MTPSVSTQNALSLAGRALIALLFIPAGLSKIGSFAGVAGYIASKGVPLPEVCAALAIAAELGLGLLILLGWQTRWAALGMADFYRGDHLHLSQFLGCASRAGHGAATGLLQEHCGSGRPVGADCLGGRGLEP
jgi:hypothetical protein